MFGTLQRQLPQELRLAGITTMAAANRFLQERFIPEHNSRFRLAPTEAASAFIPYAGRDLADILSIQEERVVGNDNTVRYRNRILQIPADRHRHVKCHVRVSVRFRGSTACPRSLVGLARSRRGLRRRCRAGSRAA